MGLFGKSSKDKKIEQLEKEVDRLTKLSDEKMHGWMQWLPNL